MSAAVIRVSIGIENVHKIELTFYSQETINKPKTYAFIMVHHTESKYSKIWCIQVNLNAYLNECININY